VKIRGTAERSSESRRKRRDDKRKGISKQGNATRHQNFGEVEGSSETSALTPTVLLAATFPVSFKTTSITKKSKRKYKQEKRTHRPRIM
jgi:hypothetical protein